MLNPSSLSISPAMEIFPQFKKPLILCRKTIPGGYESVSTLGFTELAHLQDKDNGGAYRAVAAMVHGEHISFYECGFVSVQDTLWDKEGHHLFKSCYIEGHVDFIFGDGTSVYEDCKLNSIGSGYITAQKRESPQAESGFVFKSAELYGVGPTYLGRAYGPYSRVLFYQSKFANIVRPEGWDSIGEDPNQLTYAEVECTGEGADTSKRCLPFLLLIFILQTIFFEDSRAAYFRSDEKYFPSQVSIAKTITVASSGQANFRKIQDAIDVIPSGNNEWIRIKVSPGVYFEKVNIPIEKPYIFLEGHGAEATIIKWGDHSETNQSATFTSSADNFVAKDISFQNSYNMPLYPTPPIKPAAAATIYGDKSAFYSCGFVGLQDTLWDVSGRHYFSHCYIEGAVDFICGDGQSFYENCHIKVNGRLLPSGAWGGYITAQKRSSPSDHSGFVFHGGLVVGSGKFFLGRAWGPYSRVIFQGTRFDIDVMPEGWDAWRQPVGNLVYVEQGCSGKGSDVRKRVEWSKHSLNESEMQLYSRAYFIQDTWLATQPGRYD
ncbi:unnamed protein product, partial [Vitis vinifera]